MIKLSLNEFEEDLKPRRSRLAAFVDKLFGRGSRANSAGEEAEILIQHLRPVQVRVRVDGIVHKLKGKF